MEPRIDVITLAVDDLHRSLAFYRDGLGLETRGVVATEFVDEETNAAGAIVIFHLRGGLVLALYPKTEPRWMRCSPKPRRPARLLRGNPTIARGGSTPATSATPTDTSGRSSGTRRAKTARNDRRRHALDITGQRSLPQLRVTAEFTQRAKRRHAACQRTCAPADVRSTFGRARRIHADGVASAPFRFATRLSGGRSESGQQMRQTVRSACVGERRAARMAGSSPARAPMRTAAARPPAQAVVGLTTAQCLRWA